MVLLNAFIGTNATSPLKTYGAPKQGVPVSVDFVSTDPQLMVAAYAPGTAHIIDVVSYSFSFPGINFDGFVVIRKPAKTSWRLILAPTSPKRDTDLRRFARIRRCR